MIDKIQDIINNINTTLDNSNLMIQLNSYKSIGMINTTLDNSNLMIQLNQLGKRS